MVTFNFSKYGENLGTRALGAKVRTDLQEILKGTEVVILDFSEVNVVGNAFADECIGKLLLEMPLDELKRKTTFKGLNDFARTNIAVALRRRAMQAA